MIAVHIKPEYHQLVAALNNGVVPEIEPLVNHYLVVENPYSGSEPVVMDIVEMRAFCAKRKAEPQLIAIFTEE
jgi:hypothetical protein